MDGGLVHTVMFAELGQGFTALPCTGQYFCFMSSILDFRDKRLFKERIAQLKQK